VKDEETPFQSFAEAPFLGWRYLFTTRRVAIALGRARAADELKTRERRPQTVAPDMNEVATRLSPSGGSAT